MHALTHHMPCLQASYLTWGALQEQIMTQTYGEGDEKEQFKISQFLVFVNRILAFVTPSSPPCCSLLEPPTRPTDAHVLATAAVRPFVSPPVCAS